MTTTAPIAARAPWDQPLTTGQTLPLSERLMRALEPDLCYGLFRVLLETIARDSQKHAYVLRYLLRSVEPR